MGIGNTTPSTAIASAFTGVSVAKIAGRGTGLDDASMQRKIAMLEQALRINQPDPADPLDVLAKVGELRDRRNRRHHPGRGRDAPASTVV